MYSGSAVQGVEDGTQVKYTKYTVPQAARIAEVEQRTSAVTEASFERVEFQLLYAVTQPQTTAITGTRQMTHNSQGIEYSQQGRGEVGDISLCPIGTGGTRQRTIYSESGGLAQSVHKMILLGMPHPCRVFCDRVGGKDILNWSDFPTLSAKNADKGGATAASSFDHASLRQERRLTPYITMHTRLAGIKPN